MNADPIRQAAWSRAADAVRAAFGAGDPGLLGPLLAEDVRWHGAGPGGCRSAEQVRSWVAQTLAAGVRLRLVGLRRSDARLLLRVALDPGGEVHQMWVLDDAGRITRMLDYTDPAVAAADLALPEPAAAAGPVGRLVPFVGVRDVEASVAFYRLLGFEVTREHRAHGRRVWVALRSGGAELMLAEGDRAGPADGVLLYLYSPDLAGLRAHLRAHGATPSEIVDGAPGPRAEMRVDDPDGHCLMIAAAA